MAVAATPGVAAAPSAEASLALAGVRSQLADYPEAAALLREAVAVLDSPPDVPRGWPVR